MHTYIQRVRAYICICRAVWFDTLELHLDKVQIRCQACLIIFFTLFIICQDGVWQSHKVSTTKQSKESRRKKLHGRNLLKHLHIESLGSGFSQWNIKQCKIRLQIVSSKWCRMYKGFLILFSSEQQIAQYSTSKGCELYSPGLNGKKGFFF